MAKKQSLERAHSSQDASATASLPAREDAARRATSISSQRSSHPPTVSMHMTTRGSQKAASASPASHSGDSRRSSISHSMLDSDASDVQTQGPTKRPRLSTENVTDRIPSSRTSQSDGSASPREEVLSNSKSTSSSKRRRSDEDEGNELTAAASAGEVVELGSTQDAVIEPPPKKRRGRRPKNAGLGTPAADSDIVSAAATQQVKRRPGRPRTLKRAPSNTGLPPAGPRLPGRRRAPHPDAVVEAKLVRQAELRRNYRTLAKALKPALIELGERSTKILESSLDAHKAFAQYKVVQKSLDARLSQRLGLVEREYQLNRGNKAGMLEAEKAVVHNDFKRKFYDLQDDMLHRCQDEFIRVIHSMGVDHDAEATEDEDSEAIPPAKRFGPLPGASRSYLHNKTERAFTILEATCRMRNVLQSYAPEVLDEKPEYLASVNAPLRAEAIAHSNVEALAMATQMVDELDGERAAATHDQSTGLQSLVAAIETQNGAPQVTPTSKSHRGFFDTPTTRNNSLAKSTPSKKPRSTSSSAKGTLVGEGMFISTFNSVQQKRPGPATKRPTTPEHRAEPKLGLFLTPKSAATTRSTAVQGGVESPQTPTRSVLKEMVSAKNSVNKSRTLAPKATSHTPKARPNGSNPLSNILNDDDAPSTSPSYSSTGRANGPSHVAVPQTSGYQEPMPPTFSTASQNTGRSYQGYDRPSTVLYSPTLPPPPPYNNYPSLPSVAAQLPQAFPAASLQSFALSSPVRTPAQTRGRSWSVGSQGMQSQAQSPIMPSPTSQMAPTEAFWGGQRLNYEQPGPPPGPSALPPPPYAAFPPFPPLASQVSQGMPPPPPPPPRFPVQPGSISIPGSRSLYNPIGPGHIPQQPAEPAVYAFQAYQPPAPKPSRVSQKDDPRR